LDALKEEPKNEERTKHKFSGILSADAVEYRGVTREDEALSIHTSGDTKSLMSKLIQ
jgi:hypothetical protein